MARIIHLLVLIRVVNCLMASASVWVGAYLTTGPALTVHILTAMAGAFFVCAAGNVVNDLCDIATDTTSHPNRPLVTGAISIRLALRLAIFLHVLALIAALISNFYVLSVALSSLLLLLAYNLRLKRIPVWGNLAIALLAALSFWCGGLAASPHLALALPGPLVPATFAFFFHLIREVIKDSEDIAGDRSAGIVTLPQLIGLRAVAAIALLLFLGLVYLTLIPVWRGWYGETYKIIVVVVIDIPLLLILTWTLARPSPTALAWSRVGLKLGMVAGLIALVAA